MAKFNRSIAPYYDDYDSDKQYTHLLAIPGRVAQAREITQIQSVMKDIIKSVGDSIMKDGNIIEGCQVILNKVPVIVDGVIVGDITKSATITAGKVYLNGIVLPVAETTVSLKGEYPANEELIETIGFKLDEVLITEYEDETLRDPAIGYDNQTQPGCYRVKSSVAIVVNDPDSAILAKLINGEVSTEKYAPEYDVLTQTLATRTKEESGSYVVQGYGVRVEDNPADETMVNIVVEPGIAYVNGYRRELKSARRIPLERAISTKPIVRDSILYSGGDYKLSTTGRHVREIRYVRGLINSPVIGMTTPTTNNSTQNIPISDSRMTGPGNITRVYDNAGNTYESGIHWVGEDNGEKTMSIRWLGTNTPTRDYLLECNYQIEFVQGQDYELFYDEIENSHELHWITNASKPIPGSYINLGFDLYLARKDIIHMNQDGDISIIRGNDAEYGQESLPESAIDTLELAHILHEPNSDYDNIEISNVALTRFTMNDIQNLLTRIRNLEYNQTITSLQEDTKQRNVAGTRRSIFTDPLIDFSKTGYDYNRGLDGGKVDTNRPIYDATIDFDANICYLPALVKSYDMMYSNNSTTKRYGRVATLGTTGESTVVLSQMNATKTFLVNPYEKFPQLPEISLTPAVDSWIEDTIIEVPLSQNNSKLVSSSTRHTESTSVYSGKGSTYTKSSSSSKTTAIGTQVETKTTESVVNEQAITHIRGREITIEGNNFPPNLNNIKCYFEGEQIPLTPAGDEWRDSQTEVGAIKASPTGTVSARFDIPKGKFLTGIREVKLETSIPGYGSEGVAYALYQAAGTARTIKRTITTITTVLLHRVTTVHTTTYVDPVGQTFVLDRMTLLSGINLYFAAKPLSNTSITCDIREVLNGTITSTILGHKTLPASSVHTSTTGETATRFDFDAPVLLEPNKEYAFVVRSSSADYRLWVAELGENDVVTKNPVLTNPYLIGVMMSSSNNSSWTAHQTTDIKFQLLSDVYTNESELFCNPIHVTDEDTFSRLYLLAESVIPEGTNIIWYYSFDGVDYTTINPYQIRHFSSLYSTLYVKAKLVRNSDNNLSPLVAIDTISSVLSHYDNEGCYVSIDFPGNDYNRVDIILNTYKPDKLKVWVSTDNGDTLIEALKSGNSTPLNYNWEEITYRAALPSATNANCRIIITMEGSAVETPAFNSLRAITYKV